MLYADEEAIKAAKREYIVKGPRTNTFSARKPAYAGTPLEARKQKKRPQGGTRKVCPECRRIYELEDSRETCLCGGRLCTMNTEYHQKTEEEIAKERQAEDSRYNWLLANSEEAGFEISET